MIMNLANFRDLYVFYYCCNLVFRGLQFYISSQKVMQDSQDKLENWCIQPYKWFPMITNGYETA